MKTVVTTFYTESYQPLADIVIPNLNLYCQKHGYDIHVDKIPDGNFHFIKTVNARKLMDEYDLVFAIELDAMIMNHTIKIESFLHPNYDMFYATDINGANFGVFLARSTDWMKQLFDWINMQKDKHGDEQNIMEQSPNIQEVKRLTEHPNINSIPYKYYSPSYGKIGYRQGDIIREPTHEQGNFKVGDFVCHLPGKTLQDRISIFNELKSTIIYE